MYRLSFQNTHTISEEKRKKGPQQKEKIGEL